MGVVQLITTEMWIVDGAEFGRRTTEWAKPLSVLSMSIKLSLVWKAL